MGTSIRDVRTSALSFAWLAFALGLALPLPAHAQEPDEAEVEAQQTLHRARLYYDRGEFEGAVSAFDSILKAPVKLRAQADLHEGFLYYAFTLYLQGDQEGAVEKLQVALSIEPEYEPSPVTTRPDILSFYLAQRERYQRENGTGRRLLEEIFPELRDTTGQRVTRKLPFIPLFGRGLWLLGHKRWGVFFAITEGGSLALNLAGVALIGTTRGDRSPGGTTAMNVGFGLSHPTFVLFWAALAVDLVASISLHFFYKAHPDRMPARRPGGRVRPRAPPRVSVTGAGIAVQFW